MQWKQEPFSIGDLLAHPNSVMGQGQNGRVIWPHPFHVDPTALFGWMSLSPTAQGSCYIIPWWWWQFELEQMGVGEIVFLPLFEVLLPQAKMFWNCGNSTTYWHIPTLALVTFVDQHLHFDEYQQKWANSGWGTTTNQPGAWANTCQLSWHSWTSTVFTRRVDRTRQYRKTTAIQWLPWPLQWNHSHPTTFRLSQTLSVHTFTLQHSINEKTWCKHQKCVETFVECLEMILMKMIMRCWEIQASGDMQHAYHQSKSCACMHASSLPLF